MNKVYVIERALGDKFVPYHVVLGTYQQAEEVLESYSLHIGPFRIIEYVRSNQC